ncbi:MAG TPA: acetate--CoA ligase family protein, partial [Acidimicrobiales bacterium]|nr:acetate--CoA ligase family protein [Acidimicrobiales bacterium]
PGFHTLVDSGLPMFRSFRNCFAALHAFARYQEQATRFRVRPAMSGKVPVKARPVLEAAAARPTEPLGAEETRTLLAAFGVPLVADGVATSAADASRLASELGFPVVMKVASPDFPHKSDAGLVRLGVSSAAEVRDVFRELLERASKANSRARIEGVQVQQQVGGGTEMIVGVTRDPVLGPAVLVGTGGVFAEILADVAVRPLPIDRADAEEMVRSLRGAALLDGARGRAKADLKGLVGVIMAVASMAGALGDRLVELDLNPVVVRSKGAAVVDTLVVLAGADNMEQGRTAPASAETGKTSKASNNKSGKK